MRKLFLIVFIPLLLVGCQQKKKSSSTDRLAVSDLSDTVTFAVREKNVTTVSIPKPKNKIKASEFIEDFRYIPLETMDKSYMGQYRDAYIYDNRIFVQDIESKRVCIFDMNGKFINKIGNQGSAPGEFAELTSMAIDMYQNRLVAYDQFWKKLFYFTLDGEFLYTQTMPLNFDHEFRFVGSNLMAFKVVDTDSKRNPYLKDLIKYNIIYADSALNIKGGVLEGKEYYHPNCYALSFSSNQKKVACTSTYFPRFYEFEGNELVCKYQFDYPGFSDVFNVDDFLKVADEEKFSYFVNTVRLLPPVFFTDRFFWFKNQTKNRINEFYTYYDRVSNKAKSFVTDHIEWDTELEFVSVLTAYQDYFVGYVPAISLIKKKEQWENSGRKMDENIGKVIDGLETDDNAVLVLFKVKPIQ